MNVVAITQARYGSSRLPGKVLKKIGNVPVLQIHLERILKSNLINTLIVATTHELESAKIVEIAEKNNVPYYKGSLLNVLDRYYNASLSFNPDYIVRITSDCPLIDSKLIDKVIKFTIDNNLDYASNNLLPTYPDGQDVEVFTFKALKYAWENAKLKSEKEHVTPYIKKNSSFLNPSNPIFKSDNYNEGYHFEDIRLTIDEEADLKMMKVLIKNLGIDKDWLDYTEYLINNSLIRKINANIIRNEGYLKSIEQE